jgi:hypothetical protein
MKPIDAVVAGVQAPADEPLPTRCITGIEGRVPVLIPIQKVGEFLEAFGNVVDRHAVVHARVRHVGLGYERWRWGDRLLFLPVNRNLGVAGVVFIIALGGLARLCFCFRLGHEQPSPFFGCRAVSRAFLLDRLSQIRAVKQSPAPAQPTR